MSDDGHESMDEDQGGHFELTEVRVVEGALCVQHKKTAAADRAGCNLFLRAPIQPKRHAQERDTRTVRWRGSRSRLRARNAHSAPKLTLTARSPPRRRRTPPPLSLSLPTQQQTNKKQQQAQLRDRAEQEAKIAEFELRRQIKSTVVPTDDGKVRQMLRALA